MMFTKIIKGFPILTTAAVQRTSVLVKLMRLLLEFIKRSVGFMFFLVLPDDQKIGQCFQTTTEAYRYSDMENLL